MPPVPAGLGLGLVLGIGPGFRVRIRNRCVQVVEGQVLWLGVRVTVRD